MSKKLAVGISGSFCNHSKCLEVLQELQQQGYDISIVVTPNVLQYDTRFGTSKDFLKKLEEITLHPLITTIVEAEWAVNQKQFDQMLIMPCTATTLSKLTHGNYENAVILCAKSLLRNQHPITLAIASNDSLGISGVNIMQLMNTKNIFFVPFGQDDYKNKPNSLVSDFTKVLDSIESAYHKVQLQPVLLGPKGGEHV
ncbi:MAG: dipicolinate synthase subunit B [Erysipelotrichaceae bacterium]|nr:dipicolinate synthase subunit B [Erysipelotrichaceae bacterium]